MTRTLPEALGWVESGTKLCRQALDSLDEETYDEPSGLPAWTRKHVVAHLAGNAEGLDHLVAWARTGIQTPMYASQDSRLQGIEQGAKLPDYELRSWFEMSADTLAEAMSEVTPQQWQAEIRTGQGRRVPASELPWLRAREVMVHAVDLATGLTFSDLPEDFCAALRTDIIAKRDAHAISTVHGAPAEVTAWLAGRPYHRVTTTSGDPARPLPPWL